LININDLTFKYANADNTALNDISLQINDSEFVLITGPSGCGKSTLCRCINGLIPSFYGGEITGESQVCDLDTFHTPTKDLAKKIGMVFQDPENQLVSTDVEREIAFGLENQGMQKTLMAKRVEEVLDTVGIDHLRYRQISTLSGGEKQKTAIASVLVLHPEILVLDEPTSELDPKGAEEVIQLIKRLNEELGLTVILVEHRIDRVLQYADRLITMNQGTITYDGNPCDWINNAGSNNTDVGMPPIARLSLQFKQRNIKTKTPLTIKEGRQNFSQIFKDHTWGKKVSNHMENKQITDKKPIVSTKNLWYKYPDGQTVLRQINIDIHHGEFISLIGRNAAGKTTLAKMLNGLLKPSKGRVEICGLDTKRTTVENLAKRVGYVFQDPNMHLFADTVDEEITFMMNNLGCSSDYIEKTLDKILTQFNLKHCRMSAGERQRVALASVLSSKPQLLILDEPTRGLNYALKEDLMKYIINYQKNGGTIILITHDIELIAEYGKRVILMSEGKIIADGNKHEVLSNSLHFSPQINRLIQPFSKYNIPSDILTVDEIMQGFK